MNKRFFDVLLSVIIFFFLIILLAIAAILIISTSRGPVIFWSKRVGLHNQIFEMPKLRTMADNTPNIATHLLDNPNQYVTFVGKILRKTSIDELPQLWSVFKGDMSLVGPRPALFNQYNLIKLRTKKGVHKIKPGITGWAQIHGRDMLTIKEKIILDEYYLLNESFFLDLKIIMYTVFKLFNFKNVTH